MWPRNGPQGLPALPTETTDVSSFKNHFPSGSTYLARPPGMVRRLGLRALFAFKGQARRGVPSP